MQTVANGPASMFSDPSLWSFANSCSKKVIIEKCHNFQYMQNLLLLFCMMSVEFH